MKQIRPPQNKWRTVDGNGNTRSAATREEVDALGREVADDTNGSVLIDEWSADHPQDELNQGWGCVGVVHPTGHVEVPPAPGERCSANDIGEGDTASIFAHAPAYDPTSSRGRFHRGTVQSVEVFRGEHVTTRVFTFTDGTKVEAIDRAVAYKETA